MAAEAQAPPAVRLPRVFLADDGRNPVGPPPGLDAGILLRDTDLAAVIDRAADGGTGLAVDLDTVRGLAADDAAVDFLVARLGIRIVLTRRPQVASAVAARGGLGLVQLLAFDSTGLARSLEGHPREPGVGTVVTPGLVLAHMLPEELARLPRPVVAYGLLDRPADAVATLGLADAIAVAPRVALGIMRERTARAARPAGNPLTTVRGGE